eukprot:GHVN01067836.1.p2 GENE.GHVN01067836.1~~GHVN01067836.1.p2  ORF type:complete len:434 (-),score=52.61 GHVN01067836.1:2151-3452(-)
MNTEGPVLGEKQGFVPSISGGSIEAYLNYLVIANPETKLKMFKNIAEYLSQTEHTTKGREIIALVAEHIAAPVLEIRVSAFELISKHLKKDWTLFFDIYECFVWSFELGCEKTSHAALDLLGLLPTKASNILVSFPSRKKLKFTNQLFILLCGLVSAHFPSIRERALTLLAKLSPNMPMELLEQAFSKEEIAERNGPDSCLPHNNTSMDGAFIYGIESEYSSIRKQTIETVFFYAMGNPKAGAFAIDLIIDNLNDEEAHVRLFGANKLSLLSQKYNIKLGTEQLTEVLLTLEDTQTEIRQEIMAFLEKASFHDQECFERAVASLTLLATKKPEIEKLLHCLYKIGKKNHVFLQKSALLEKKDIPQKKHSIREGVYLARVSLAVGYYEEANKTLSNDTLPAYRYLLWTFGFFSEEKIPKLDPVAHAGRDALHGL